MAKILQLPDAETRCAIILSKTKQENIIIDHNIDHNIAMFLAECVPENIRSLEGALISVAAQASIGGVRNDNFLKKMECSPQW